MDDVIDRTALVLKEEEKKKEAQWMPGIPRGENEMVFSIPR
jgi:hypothetical protein